jgi:hypothetical protein
VSPTTSSRSMLAGTTTCSQSNARALSNWISRSN